MNKIYNQTLLNLIDLEESKILLESELLKLNSAISELHHDMLEQHIFEIFIPTE
jgi:hypothetical protein